MDRGNKLIACSVHLANDNADPNKLDHIFYARRAWQPATGDVGSAGSGLSDH